MNNIHAIELKITELFKKKDAKAVNLIFENYGRALYGVIYKVVNNPEDCEEVLQDVLVKIWENSASYDRDKGRLYTWMLNISRNAAIDKVRSKLYKQGSKTNSQEDYVDIDKSTIGIRPDDIGIKDLLTVLEKDQRDILNLAYFQGYTQKEISDELKMPLGTVKTKVRYALSSLKDYLKNEY